MAGYEIKMRLRNALASALACCLGFLAAIVAGLWVSQRAFVDISIYLLIIALKVSFFGFLLGLFFKEQRMKRSAFAGGLLALLLAWYAIQQVTPDL